MNLVDTVKNTTLAATGRTKEIAGFIVKNRDLEAEGRLDQLTANLRQAGNRAKGSVDSLRKAVNF